MYLSYTNNKLEKLAWFLALVVLAAMLFLMTAPVVVAQEETESQATEETQPQETEETVPVVTMAGQLSLTFYYPDRTETVGVTPGSSFTQMYPGIAPESMTAQKEHCTFVGWFESADGGVTFSEQAFDFQRGLSEDVSLYPQFRLNTYTVSFMMGNEVLETQTVEHGAAAVLPQIPEKEGWIGAWDHDGQNITADTVINLVYTRSGAGEFLLSASSDNFGGGWLSETGESLAQAIPLTQEEQTLLADGADVTVRLALRSYLEGVPAEDRALVEGVLGDMSLGLFLEVSLFKQLGEAQETQLKYLNDSITVSFMLPESLLPEDGSGRAFTVIRVHEGAAEAVDTIYDRESGVLSFSTDRFSTYALVYADIAQQLPPAFTPATGDSFHGWLWLLCLAASGAAIGLLFGRHKKVM